MTKYVLAGGCDRKYQEYWERLSSEVLSEFSRPKVLSCLFSQEVKDRPLKHRQFDDFFMQFFGDNVEVSHANEVNFYEQLEHANVLYLHGGKTQLLLDSIPDTERFLSAVNKKIVIGSSAGANFLSRVCFSPSASKVIESTGILNIGVVVHYGIDQFEDTVYSNDFWDNAVSTVRLNLKDDTPVVLLPEGTFAIFER